MDPYSKWIWDDDSRWGSGSLFLGACDFAQIMAAFKILCVYIHNIYSDGHSVRTSKFFQNFIAPQLEPKNFAQLEPWFAKGSNSLEPWFAKGSNSGGNTNQL